MPLTGTLRTWHDDRGFGFIAPTHGGAELFVHISAFPRDGGRPTQGERLQYELGRGRQGEVQAVNVTRLAVGAPAQRRHVVAARPRRWSVLIVIAALGVAGALGYDKLRGAAFRPMPQTVTAPEAEAPAASFRCDGRRHCWQMTSCAEARYFLKNCPGVEMDGNHDGTPCEQKWCTSPFSR
ncbi:MAG: cold-shock protein [Rubrivivax sp.]|nr:MAG: cold-shock protein [Rubrivivax sp.]